MLQWKSGWLNLVKIIWHFSESIKVFRQEWAERKRSWPENTQLDVLIAACGRTLRGFVQDLWDPIYNANADAVYLSIVYFYI